jgi:Icc protein
MPIHLAPISRRRFLARSLAAGAGLALRPSLFAADKPVDPNFWALLSDIHLAADRATVSRNVNMTQHFTNVSDELLTLPTRPAGVFINGDCAFNLGEMGDYALLAELLRPLRAGQMPIHLSLGNHDNRTRFWESFREAKEAQRPVVDKNVSLLPTRRANWFILDSLETTASTPGLLGADQLLWLAKTLDANPDKPALVLVHHNPGIAGNIGLRDTTALFEVIRPRRQVKAYFFGHTHVWRIKQDPSGIHLVNLPAVAYVFREGEPSGWVRATLEPAGMKLELHCTDPTHQANGQVVNLSWRA